MTIAPWQGCSLSINITVHPILVFLAHIITFSVKSSSLTNNAIISHHFITSCWNNDDYSYPQQRLLSSSTMISMYLSDIPATSVPFKKKHTLTTTPPIEQKHNNRPIHKRASTRTRTPWSSHFNELCTHIALCGRAYNGNASYPSTKLKTWIQTQRCQYRHLLTDPQFASKTYTKLPAERCAALLSIGFEWNIADAKWKHRFDELRTFHSIYGHSMVPEDYDEHAALGTWAANQRTSYKIHLQKVGKNKEGGFWRRKGLTHAKIEALESIGFSWKPSHLRWDDMYQRLKIYGEKRRLCWEQEGQMMRPGTDSTDEYETKCQNYCFHIPTTDVQNRHLRTWISVQRHQYANQNRHDQKQRSSSMTPQRRAALEIIGFPWMVPRAPIFCPFLEHNMTRTRSQGPTVEDWNRLFEEIKELSQNVRNARPKDYWLHECTFKDRLMEKESWDLWNNDEGD